MVPVEARVGRLTDGAKQGLGRWAFGVQREGDRLQFEAKAAALPEIVRYLVEQGADIYQLAPQRLSLEELFLEIVGKDEGL